MLCIVFFGFIARRLVQQLNLIATLPPIFSAIAMRICHVSILQYKLENLIEFQIANYILQLDCMRVILGRALVNRSIEKRN